MRGWLATVIRVRRLRIRTLSISFYALTVNTMLLICKYCWCEFKSIGSSKKYCSRECWHKDREYDLTWKKFWSLSVIERIWNEKGKWVCWLCECVCGKRIKRPTNKLTAPWDHNCWCKRKKAKGLVWTQFYHKYCSIRARCDYPTSDNYPLYWGRWIKCERKTFIDFYNDMYDSYLKHVKKYGKSKTTIDRIDSNWNYCKENCRRATPKQQANNTRRNRLITYWGDTLTATQRAEKIWITINTFYWKLTRWVPMEWIVKHPHKRRYSYYDIDEQLKKYS